MCNELVIAVEEGGGGGIHSLGRSMGCKTLYLFHRNSIYIINHLLVYALSIPHHYGTKNKDETSTLRINYSKKKTVEVLSAKSFSPVTETNAQLLVKTDIFQK